MGKLTTKQKLFVQEYLIDGNATQAAIRAGYSPKTAFIIGHENIRKPNISDGIQKAQDERLKRTEITQDKVLKDIDAIKADAMRDDNGQMIDRQAALKACELLGRHLKLFTDKVEAALTVEWLVELDDASSN